LQKIIEYRLFGNFGDIISNGQVKGEKRAGKPLILIIPWQDGHCFLMLKSFRQKNRVFLNHVNKKEMPLNIYVGNLSYEMDEQTLKAMFDEFGDVASSKIIKDRYSGRSKGFGFIEMPSNSEADQAIKALNGKFMDGKHIKVNHADPGGKKKSKRSFKPRRY